MTAAVPSDVVNRPGWRATKRQRIAAILCVVLAVATLVTGLVGIGKLETYQVVADVVACLVLLAGAWLMLRSGTRWQVVTMAWVCAIIPIFELGNYQSRKNDTGALAATNTTYFLPDLLWLFMFLLVVLAVVISSLSARPKGLD